jgi:hypothetical protein
MSLAFLAPIRKLAILTNSGEYLRNNLVDGYPHISTWKGNYPDKLLSLKILLRQPYFVCG